MSKVSKKRELVAIAGISLAVAMLAMAGCGVIPTQSTDVTVTVGAPTPVTTPTPAPSPTSAPTGVRSDVSSMGQYVFLVECQPGVAEPAHIPGQPFSLPANCDRFKVTATPKQADGKTDAVNHGNNISWGSECAALFTVTEDPNNRLFNRIFTPIVPRRTGQSCEQSVTLVDPEGKSFVSRRTYIVGQ